MELSHSELWERFLAVISDNLPPEHFAAWFKRLSPVSYVDGTLTIDVPSHYFVEQIEVKYAGLMKAALSKVYGKDTKLFYRFYPVSNSPESAINVRGTNPSSAVKPQAGTGSNPFERKQVVDIPTNLNPSYTFENYCSGESNKLARSIGEAIANDPRCNTFNPLFIFGPSGCGKTHLMQAIGIRIKECNPETRVLYVTARLFENQYTSDLKRINDFMYFYQSIDVLIIDDIQDFIGKPGTQNAFFHIFNHLIQNQKKLILSCDCRPSQMEGMEERLLSRFKQGMTAELERPDYALRRDVLKLKAEQNGLVLADEIIDYIAANVCDSVRELEGIVVSLVAHSMVHNRDIDIDMARTVIGNAVKINKRQLNFEMIVDAVASHYDIDTELIFTKTRKRDISDARQLLMYLSKKHTKMSLKAIGLRLDRNHATVIHACSQTEQRLAYDKQLQADVKVIEQALLG